MGTRAQATDARNGKDFPKGDNQKDEQPDFDGERISVIPTCETIP